MKEIKEIEATVEMTLTPEMTAICKETFDIEIELLQGEKELLSDGRTKYIIQVKGHKAELIKEFMLKTMSQSHKANMS